MQILVTTRTFTRTACWVVLCLASVCGYARAQSTDIAWPAPVRTNEVAGTISARDIGDARVTDHFYAFTGTPGDVLITVDSRNLNGDVDVFTLSGLRPVLKFTVYAESAAPITKSIYLRKQEELILRVEGRTPNDDGASYRIRFSGSFETITSGPLTEHEDALQAATAMGEPGKGSRRVSSTGARIEEPTVAAAPVEPPPEPTPVEPSEPKPKTASTRSTARNSRTRRPVPRRTRPAKPAEADETAAKGETETKPVGSDAEPATKSPAPAKRPTTRSASARRVAKAPVTQDQEESGPKLIIETNDGTLIDRYMTGVRRVTVENGMVVVIGKDGKIQRIPLATVVRMTISP